MRANVAITDSDWFEYLSSQPGIDEVNFWKPGGGGTFGVLQPGEPFLFKLHAPDNFIVGGGFFAHFSKLPVSLAWETFREKNGARTYAEMRARVEKYRRRYDKPVGPHDDYTIGCILLEEPFFFRREEWISVPRDFPMNTVQGKSYDISTGIGADLWRDVAARLASWLESSHRALVPRVAEQPAERYGAPLLHLPRLGQGSFRIMVTDAYGRRCAMTGEKTLPVLEAAHIRPYSAQGDNRVDNGLLLRRDLHTLFDRGYLTVTPSLTIEVSRRIREEFSNGRDYYALHGRVITAPGRSEQRPAREFLDWHASTIFRG